MPIGKIDKDGLVTITYNPCRADKLLTNGGTEQLLPCEKCGEVLTVSLRTVSVICENCSQ